MPFTKQRALVEDLEMAYVDTGRGEPIVFLHGNPTSSYLWRNVIPHLADDYRCVAPDLVGMGDSDKRTQGAPEERYTFREHRRYLDRFLASVVPDGRVTLVIHDWGSALGFDWARRHPDRVAGIAYMEAIVRPLAWDEWPQGARPIFEAMRGPAGETICLRKNAFVERILPASVQRKLHPREMAAYRDPFLRDGEDRRPTLTWPRQIPIDGTPGDVHEVVAAYADAMVQSKVAKLFVNAEPGSILIGAQREFCRSWPNQTEVTVSGLHFVQEDAPDEIGQAILAWRGGIG